MKKTLLIILLGAISIFAQESSDWKFSGSVQLRSELDGRDFSNDTYALSFASIRTRFGVEKSLFDKVTLFAQIQDGRVFGFEPSINTNTANLDLHQGYVKLQNLFDIPFTLQAGRFEIAYSTERFFGASNWSLHGRAYDGARLSFGTEYKLDVFAVTLREPVPFIGGASPALYPLTRFDNSMSLYGFWYNNQINKENNFDVFAYYEVDRTKTNGEDSDLKRATLGLDYLGKYGMFNPTVEAAYQLGNHFDKDIAAYLIALNAMFDLKTIRINVGMDMLSGTDPNDFINDDPITSSTFNTYATTYGTNHKYYGLMDYVYLPQLGLNDFHASISFLPQESKWSFEAAIHHQMSNQSNLDDENVYGQEVDLTLKYVFVKGVNLFWGGSIYLPGDLMKRMYTTGDIVREDPGFWSYLMIQAAF